MTALRFPAHSDSVREEMAAYLVDAVTRFDVPGAAVGITHGSDEYVAVAGVTSAADPLPIDTDTLFMIGSTSKTLTATVAMTFVEKGLLHLDRPLSTYLPEILDCPDEVRPQRAAVLVRDLFTHTAGWLGDVDIDTGPGDDAYAKVVTEALPKIPQHTPPGDLASYNNKSTAVAARLVETVTGEVFETVLRDRLLVPLGLEHTFLFPSEIANRRHAIGHVTKDGRTVPVPEWPLSRCETAEGGVASSVADQVRYARFHLTGVAAPGPAPIGDDTRRSMWRPRSTMNSGLQIGINWLLRRRGGKTLVVHGGNVSYQHVSAFVMIPEDEFAVTVLTNSRGGEDLGDEAVGWALTHILDVPPDPPMAELDVPVSEMGDFLGDYEAGDSRFEVRREGSRLQTQLRYPEHPDLEPSAAEMYFTAPDTVVAAANPTQVGGVFIRGSEGDVVAFRWGVRLGNRSWG